MTVAVTGHADEILETNLADKHAMSCISRLRRRSTGTRGARAEVKGDVGAGGLTGRVGRRALDDGDELGVRQRDRTGAGQAAEVTDRMEARVNTVDFISSFQTHPGRAGGSAAEAGRVKPETNDRGRWHKSGAGVRSAVPGFKL